METKKIVIQLIQNLIHKYEFEGNCMFDENDKVRFRNVDDVINDLKLIIKQL